MSSSSSGGAVLPLMTAADLLLEDDLEAGEEKNLVVHATMSRTLRT